MYCNSPNYGKGRVKMKRNSLVKDYSIEQLEKVLAQGRSQFQVVQKSIPEAEDVQLYLKGFTYGYLTCFFTYECGEHWNHDNLSEGYQPLPLLDPENLPRGLNGNYLEIIFKVATEHCMEAIKSAHSINGGKLFERAYSDGYFTCLHTYDLSIKQTQIPKELCDIPIDVRILVDNLLNGWGMKPSRH
jgi:hypothetical protein